MVEPTHQDRCTGKGFKPPKGAVFKRYGTERLGNGSPRGCQVWIMEMIRQLAETAEEVSRSGHIQSKATEYVTE